jgi:predicted small secreted protein
MKRVATIVLLGALLCSPCAFGQAQDSQTQGAGQDMKQAGSQTKGAAKSTGSATKKTAKKATKGVKKGTHKAASKTKQGAGKVEDKTSTP